MSKIHDNGFIVLCHSILRVISFPNSTLTCFPCRLEIILSTSKKRPLSIMHLLGSDSVQKSATDMLFKAVKQPMHLFPHVLRQINAILFIVRCHELVTVKCEFPLDQWSVKMTIFMIDGSNVSSSYRCRR